MLSQTMRSIGEKMIQRLAHRGPDAQEVWTEKGICLAHSRLSIRDLSSAGAQPMFSASGRYVIVYNGEVYNSQALNQRLDKKLKGHSDTEVLLEACEAWGPVEACKHFLGMFAFALWDRKEEILYLARDRLGVKPLYWSLQNGVVFFGSTLQGFNAHPAWSPQISLSSVQHFLKLGYVPGPLSIFEDVHKVVPGTVVRIDKNLDVKKTPYWDLSFDHQEPPGTPKDWLVQLEEKVDQSIKYRMVSDVPVGAFLSGGIDSSLVVAFMQQHAQDPIHTFSIGFEDSVFNEAPYAKAIAQHLGTHHHEMYLTSHDVMQWLDHFPQWGDEPFADSSQIPTYWVSRLARQHVKVILSGDGGDELFAGYNRYKFINRRYHLMKKLPKFLHPAIAYSLKKIPKALWRALKINPLFPQKLERVLGQSNSLDFYEKIISLWDSPPLSQELPWGGGGLWHRQPLFQWMSQEAQYSAQDTYDQLPNDVVRIMQWIDLQTYLPDDILTKVDRASMAVGLEAREPLLDHTLLEFAWSLPTWVKMRRGQTKWPLRQLLYKRIPRHLLERPKMGFGVPLGSWLRGPLRQWAFDLLSTQALRSHGLFNEETIHRTLEDHMSGQNDWSSQLWTILMFQVWHQNIRSFV
jgi:asparagine synthase (glutamine-hydrolysing)